ncbi:MULTISPECIES: hypothetical protein [unclassified Crossiella]|uniref:hypothetical protein n=1 Tax=unclassified Crossiella TaxID=2620835 RepID=UPI001FFF7826|nr:MULTISPECIES: hypothetical protein [unclassified Crossiella]MCK2241593.1 hypothetical protein [Crossiella sp. S99.2]MCK2255535.1 hypothetical protein [Crossiella sp. S99.1]
MSNPGTDRRLRLCVVQLDGLPHARTAESLWLPAEPLYAAGAGPGELSAAHLFSGAHPTVYDGIQELSTSATRSCLTELMSFLDRQSADVVVFPEYLVPLGCLETLREFSAGRVVVAGLGFVRNLAEAGELVALAESDWQAGNLVHRNVSVLIHDGSVHLITKLSLADGENATAGEGVRIVELTLRGRQVRLAVAVCKDYLLWESNATVQRADIVCVPANSPTMLPFQPDAPRDHVRLLANAACHGGSQIIVPALDGPLVNRLGVEPIGKGFQAVILVEYDSYPRRPTALANPENSLALRAQIIGAADAAELAVLAELAELTATTPGKALRAQVSELRARLAGTGPLVQALEAYDIYLAQGFDPDKELHDLLCTHLAVTGGGQSVIRGRQARYIVSMLRELEAACAGSFGAARDTYQRLAERFAAADEPELVVVPVPRQAPPAEPERPSLLKYTRSTARDGTRSESWEIHDPDLAREFLLNPPTKTDRGASDE